MYDRTKISDVLVPGMPPNYDGKALPLGYVDKWGRHNNEEQQNPDNETETGKED